MAEPKPDKLEYDHQIAVRCWKRQRDQWQNAAKNDQRTLADWVRIKLDDAAQSELKDDK